MDFSLRMRDDLELLLRRRAHEHDLLVGEQVVPLSVQQVDEFRAVHDECISRAQGYTRLSLIRHDMRDGADDVRDRAHRPPVNSGHHLHFDSRAPERLNGHTTAHGSS